MPGDVGPVFSFMEKVFVWAVGEDGYATLKKKRMLKQRNAIAQGMLANARTQQDWDALRAFNDDTLRM